MVTNANVYSHKLPLDSWGLVESKMFEAVEKGIDALAVERLDIRVTLG